MCASCVCGCYARIHQMKPYLTACCYYCCWTQMVTVSPLIKTDDWRYLSVCVCMCPGNWMSLQKEEWLQPKKTTTTRRWDEETVCVWREMIALLEEKRRSGDREKDMEASMWDWNVFCCFPEKWKERKRVFYPRHTYKDIQCARKVSDPLLTRS